MSARVELDTPGEAYLLEEFGYTVESPDGELIVGRSDIGLAVLLNRPSRANALTGRQLQHLASTWASCANDRTVKSVVVGAVGPKFFSAGRDMHDAVESPPETAGNDIAFTPRMAGVEVPVICAVNGLTIGAGLHFPASADLVIADHQASFGDSHVTLGFSAAPEVLMMASRVGANEALRMTLLGEEGRITAERGFQLGFVQEVVPEGGVLRRALSIARVLDSASPSAVRSTLAAARAANSHVSASDIAEAWNRAQAQLDHPDSTEGPSAWVEGRQPQWVV